MARMPDTPRKTTLESFEEFRDAFRAFVRTFLESVGLSRFVAWLEKR